MSGHGGHGDHVDDGGGAAAGLLRLGLVAAALAAAAAAVREAARRSGTQMHRIENRGDRGIGVAPEVERPPAPDGAPDLSSRTTGATDDDTSTPSTVATPGQPQQGP